MRNRNYILYLNTTITNKLLMQIKYKLKIKHYKADNQLNTIKINLKNALDIMQV